MRDLGDEEAAIAPPPPVIGLTIDEATQMVSLWARAPGDVMLAAEVAALPLPSDGSGISSIRLLVTPVLRDGKWELDAQAFLSAGGDEVRLALFGLAPPSQTILAAHLFAWHGALDGGGVDMSTSSGLRALLAYGRSLPDACPSRSAYVWEDGDPFVAAVLTVDGRRAGELSPLCVPCFGACTSITLCSDDCNASEGALTSISISQAEIDAGGITENGTALATDMRKAFTNERGTDAQRNVSRESAAVVVGYDRPRKVDTGSDVLLEVPVWVALLQSQTPDTFLRVRAVFGGEAAGKVAMSPAYRLDDKPTGFVFRTTAAVAAADISSDAKLPLLRVDLLLGSKSDAEGDLGIPFSVVLSKEKITGGRSDSTSVLTFDGNYGGVYMFGSMSGTPVALTSFLLHASNWRPSRVGFDLAANVPAALKVIDLAKELVNVNATDGTDRHSLGLQLHTSSGRIVEAVMPAEIVIDRSPPIVRRAYFTRSPTDYEEVLTSQTRLEAASVAVLAYGKHG